MIAISCTITIPTSQVLATFLDSCTGYLLSEGGTPLRASRVQSHIIQANSVLTAGIRVVVEHDDGGRCDRTCYSASAACLITMIACLEDREKGPMRVWHRRRGVYEEDRCIVSLWYDYCSAKMREVHQTNERVYNMLVATFLNAGTPCMKLANSNGSKAQNMRRA